MIFDSHAHLDDSRYDDDRDEVIERARKAGVELIMNPGADFESSKRAIELSRKYDIIYAAVGVHPHSAKEMDAAMLLSIEEMTSNEKVKAIGEIGLDYYYDFSPKEDQKLWFVEQLRLAKRLGLPVIIHDRDAHQDVMDLLKREQSFDTGVLMHCFSGSAELARQYVQLGAYISIAGPVTFKNSRKLVEVVETTPLDKLLIETDSPYLTPIPFRGKRNESFNVKFVGEKIALIKGLDKNEVFEATTKNAKEFFKIK